MSARTASKDSASRFTALGDWTYSSCVAAVICGNRCSRTICSHTAVAANAASSAAADTTRTAPLLEVTPREDPDGRQHQRRDVDDAVHQRQHDVSGLHPGAMD